MNVFLGHGRVNRGFAPCRSHLTSWIAGMMIVLGLLGSATDAGVVTVADAKSPAQSIKWVDQTWVIVPTDTGTWALMLAMTYAKDGSVTLPIGIISGEEAAQLTTSDPPSSMYHGFTNTSIVQSRIGGILVINPQLVTGLDLDPTYDGSIFSVRWNYTHPTEGAAYVQVGSIGNSEWEPILTMIRNHYESTVDPALLPEWDTATTTLQDKHDKPGRVKPSPAGGARWRWIAPLIPILWDILRPTATPLPQPPAPAKAPGCAQCIADCRAQVTRTADHFLGRCAVLNCPPADRQACVTCVQLMRDLQLSNCDRNVAVDGGSMLACTQVACQ